MDTKIVPIPTNDQYSQLGDVTTVSINVQTYTAGKYRLVGHLNHKGMLTVGMVKGIDWVSIQNQIAMGPGMIEVYFKVRE